MIYSRLTTLTGTFGRSALRQPVFAALLLAAPLLGLLIRPMPGLLERFVPGFDFYQWVPLFLAVTAGFPAYLFGFLASLMLLDERDSDLLPAMRVTPLSDGGLLAAKVLPAMILALVGTPIALSLSGQLSRISPGAVIAAALIAAPSAAFYALIAAALARNKVQGITIGKILGTVLPAPVLLVLLPPPWRFIALVFPSAWMGGVIGNHSLQLQWLWAAGGLLYASALALLAWRAAMKRYFET